MIDEIVTFIGDCGRKVANILFVPNGVTFPFFVELFEDDELIGIEGPFLQEDAEDLAASFINGDNDDTFI